MNNLELGTSTIARAADIAAAPDGERVFPGSAMLEVLVMLARHKQLILTTTLITIVLGVGVALLLPNCYTATTKILPPQQSPSLAASLMGQLGSMGPMALLAQKDLGLKNANDLYVGMLRSRTIEDALIRRFDLLRVYRDRRISDARRHLERASSIELGKEGLVSISVEDTSRSRAAHMANAYAEELRKLTQNLAVTEAAQRRLFFEQHMQLAQNKLAEAEQALKQTEQRTGVIQLDGQAKSIIESVAKLRATIAVKQIELRALRISSTEQNPDVIVAEQQLSGMQAQLARLEGESGGPEQRAITAGSVPEAGLEYIRKLRDLKYAETIWDILTREYEAARLDEARDAAVIQVVDIAIEPDRKSSPQRFLIIAIAALLGLCASGAYVLVTEFLHRLRLQPEIDVRFRELKAAVLSRSQAQA